MPSTGSTKLMSNDITFCPAGRLIAVVARNTSSADQATPPVMSSGTTAAVRHARCLSLLCIMSSPFAYEPHRGRHRAPQLLRGSNELRRNACANVTRNNIATDADARKLADSVVGERRKTANAFAPVLAVAGQGVDSSMFFFSASRVARRHAACVIGRFRPRAGMRARFAG